MTDHDPVDEHGYRLTAVQAWSRHGIYPPPLAGDPNNPETVQRVKANRARWAAMSEEERAAHHRAAQQLMDDIDRRLGIDTRPESIRSRTSSSS